jgi:hypothetical protein
LSKVNCQSFPPMLSYSRIVQHSYKITIRNKVLWLFGLFVVGGFNLNFLNFQDIPIRNVRHELNVHELIIFFYTHPQTLAAVSFSLLVFSLFSLVVTNWSRIMLVLLVESLLKTKFPELREQISKSIYSLSSVVKISVGTTFLIVVAAAGLFLPPLFITQNPQLQMVLFILATLLFLPIAFAISCINIFTSFFVILFKQKLSSALNLGTDFFVSRWTQILGIFLVIMAIYVVCFFVGVSVIYILKVLFEALFDQLDGFTILPFSVIILVPKIFSSLLLWMLLGILNVFINTALLLLFLELITPVEFEEKVLQAQPAVSPVRAG